jgi:dihydrofolate synthase / folylpolyglutamate synthase
MNGDATAGAYHDAVRRLQSRGRFGVRLGLGRTRALLYALGDPHHGLRGALIAGTNGKGSVQTLVSAALRSAGYRVGQTPKPHLQTYRERIVVDGRPVDPGDFAALVGEILGVADGIPRRLGPATEFELVTAAAFEWFRRSGVDIAVVEVGLGGRLDATNVWDGGVAAITTVGLDHMEYLGPTVRDIAREKAAIIKAGDVAVSGARGDAVPVIRRRARRVGARLEEVEPLDVVGMDRTGLVVDAPGIGSLRVGLLGRHQAGNAGVALGVLRALDDAGIAKVGEAAIRAGFAEAHWPGRLELLTTHGTGGCDVLLDGAHNPEGAAALAAALDDLRPHLAGGRLTLLMAVMADKDVTGMIEALGRSELVRAARIIATTVPHSVRALPADELAAAWRRAGVRSVVAVPHANDALAAGLEAARAEGGPLVVGGSLYLVGWTRSRLVDDPLLIDPPDPMGR